jgi:hypothetical protein
VYRGRFQGTSRLIPIRSKGSRALCAVLATRRASRGTLLNENIDLVECLVGHIDHINVAVKLTWVILLLLAKVFCNLLLQVRVIVDIFRGASYFEMVARLVGKCVLLVRARPLLPVKLYSERRWATLVRRGAGRLRRRPIMLGRAFELRGLGREYWRVL